MSLSFVHRASFSVLLCVPVLSILGLTAPEARAADSAADCVMLRQSEEPRGLAFDLDNNCSRTLACTFNWTVECQSDSGKTTRVSKETRRLVVESSKTGRTFASAAPCASNWRIGDVTWECAVGR